jgi:hypothetical protein
LLREPIATLFGVEPAKLFECVMIDHGRLEAKRTSTSETVVRIDVARRIYRAVEHALMQVPAGQRRFALVSTTGGLPIIKSVVQETAHFLADRIRVFEATERKGAEESQLLSPVESLQTRRICRDLCRNGAFGEAARFAARMCIGSEREFAKKEPWRELLQRIATRQEVDFSRPASESSNPRLSESQAMRVLDDTLATLPDHARIAMQVELAFRSGQSALAIRELVRFFEAAAEYWIDRHFTSANQSIFRRGDLRFDALSPELQQRIDKRAYGYPRGSRRTEPPSQRDRLRAVIEEFASDVPETGRFLRGLERRIHARQIHLGDKKLSIKEIRNELTHGAVQASQLSDALEVLRNRDRSGPPILSKKEMRFLDSEYIKVLVDEELPQSSLREMYQQLQDAIEEDLRNLSVIGVFDDE